MQQFGSQDWRAGRIREWLLLLLRFAITCDPKDPAAACSMADEIDALGHQWRPSAPSFFRRTSDEVCAAITALDDPKRITILKKHIARIDDRGLPPPSTNANISGQACEADPVSAGPLATSCRRSQSALPRSNRAVRR